MGSEFYKQATLRDITAKAPPSPLPETVGPYKIEALLAQGGMSLLYLGLEPATKHPLAIKVLSPQFVTYPDMVGQFMKEAAIIKMTSHPNIVKVYGEGQWEGGVYIAMQLVQGVSLRQFILQHSLSLKRCLDIILQVAYALCHLHTHGVIHGDLKPENILMGEDGEIKVVDFGIAQLHQDKEDLLSDQFAGTPHYMSPEHKENPRKLAFVSDIYSLGIVAYELILGRFSFGIINLSLIPKGLRKIIGKCLAISPGERYQDIVDFITDISQYLKSGEINKDKPGTDQAKEMIEEIAQAAQFFLPVNLPDWPAAEMGLAKNFPAMSTTLYQEFWKFPSNQSLTVLAIPKGEWIESGFAAALFSGMCRALVSSMIAANPKNLNPLALIQKLNDLLIQNFPKITYQVAALHLDPVQDRITYIPCGFPELLHVPQGTRSIHKLGISNPLLGTDNSDRFNATTDNWAVGDSLILHTLPSYGKDADKILLKALEEALFFSAQHQADTLLKKTSSAFSSGKEPKLFISFQRIY